MKKFATIFPEIEFVQAPLAQLTWYHLQALMDKVPNKEAYLWYGRKNLGKRLLAGSSSYMTASSSSFIGPGVYLTFSIVSAALSRLG